MIRVTNLNKTYGRGRHANKVLHDISFTLPETGFVCILGVSGCGKTSLLNAIGGLDRFDNGTISTEDVSVSRYGTAIYETERNRNFGYIFQNYYLLMEHSVAYNVYLGLHSLDLSHAEKLHRVREALRAVEMEHYFRRTVGELSGGQQQRVAIARAIARKPRVIFADEPTGNLDEANTLNICSLLRKISKTSLVLMVTHEQHIANFFADRIITLNAGRISEDSESWERSSIATDSSKAIYAGDYTQTLLNHDGLELRFLQEEGALPISLTIAALKDRIIIKLSDSRAVSLGSADQAPQLLEGCRPMLTLETLDNHSMDGPLFTLEEQKQAKAGQGVSLLMMVQEARHLIGEKGLRRLSMRLFLILLTVLTIFSVSDYLAVASIDPEDFITSHSHILELDLEQGPVLYGNGKTLTPVLLEYMSYLSQSGQDFILVPHVSPSAKHSVKLFQQMDSISMKLEKFSYVPLSQLRESDLIYGRLPENSEEIVVDRWVLEAAMSKDGILQNSIYDTSYFLNVTLHYDKLNYSPTIVGISDCGEPAVFMDTAGLVSIGIGGKGITPLSELKERYPDQYDHVTLSETECLAVVNNAGEVYYSRIGETYSFSPRRVFTIMDAIEADVDGSIIVDDSQIDSLLWDMVNSHFHLYCPDKQAIKDFLALKGSEMEQNGHLIVTVTDRYADTYEQYQAATFRKADARLIVTATIVALSMVMLYLLCRAQAQERIGMIAVYRLLGIPGRKLAAIFSLESLLSSTSLVLPTVIAAWAVVNGAAQFPELELNLLLPWHTALLIFICILCYHLIVSLLPLFRLLRLPPAQLAAKYDL